VRKGFFGLKRTRVARGFQRSSADVAERLRRLRVGMPRVLNVWTRPRRTSADVLRGAGHSAPQNVVFCDETCEEMWVKRAASTARSTRAFPSKVAQAHIHNLLFHQHPRRQGPAAALLVLPGACRT
jgi:predicted nucleotide-binding protein (sugar kinase/HSP70/actin superfamily)